MSVVNAWAGAPTASGFRVVAKVDTGDDCRLVVADNPSLTSPTFFGPETPDAQNVVQLAATGLDPDTRWWWAVEHDGTTDTDFVGRVRTLPVPGVQASFRLGAASCAGGNPVTPGVGTTLTSTLFSNHAVFATIASRAINEDWLMWVHLGDLHYADFGLVTTDTLSNRRQAFDDVLAQPNQQLLMQAVPWAYFWSDHDYAFESQRGSYADKANAAQVYRERVPHFDLEDAAGIWQSWQIGRVLCVGWDERFYADDNTDPEPKTKLGSAQLAWFENLLVTSQAEALIIFCPDEWLGSKEDSWASFAGERDLIVEMLADHGWSRRTVMVTADLHAVGISSGIPQDWGHFPVLAAASLDSTPSSNNANRAMFDRLQITAGREQYGTVDVRDEGSHILITLSAWRDTNLLGSYTHGITLDTPGTSVATVADFAPIVSGSHVPVVEARLVDGFATGVDPDGIALDVIDGEVSYDATADVFATTQLTIVGVDETGRSLFPRRPTDPLAPYGAEIFIRRGVDLGGAGRLWSPLGYFRIEAVEQDDAPYGPIRISGRDRMAGIIEARPLRPREFAATRQAGSVIAEIVGQVYPTAAIFFDDEEAFTVLGRPLVMDESRYDVLRELATSLGKIVYWDGAGVLQVRTAPDDDVPLWEVSAGRGGVLLQAGRRVTRDGVFNAVIASGESGTTLGGPVTAVAVDAGPRSPTRWASTAEGGFGFVPRFYTSPFITTVGQAERTAREMLRRNLGAPYSVDFGVLVNPALRPWDPVRITQQDGNREVHVVERLSVPLSAGASMSASTRQTTLVVIGGES